MTNNQRRDLRLVWGVAPAIIAVALSAAAARADVTIDQDTTMNMAGINIDITTVERTSADKRRRDSATHCQGFLSLVCGNAQSGQIVRLDKQVEWQLDPKKRLYTERKFPTPEERAQAQAKLEAALEQMKRCRPAQPQATSQSAPDTSHCQLTPPTLAVKQTDEHAMVAGHDTRRTSVVMSQTCTDQQTGDVCEIDYGFDLWLTTDELPGGAEQRSFEQNYLTAQGLDRNNPQLQGVVQQYMAPYASMLRQLQSNASDLHGTPLRTTFYMAFGGPHCGKAQQAQQQSASAPQHHGFGFGRLASDAVGGRIAGLFSSHGADATTSADAGQIGANATSQATGAEGTPAGGASASGTAAAGPMVRFMSMTVETRSIDTTSISPDQFEIPVGWTLKPPAPPRTEQGPSCPAAAPQ